jgi:hypothetical protein
MPLVRALRSHVPSALVPRSLAATAVVAILSIYVVHDKGCGCQHIMGEVFNRSAGARPPFKQGDRSWAWVTSCLLLPFLWLLGCPKSPWLETFAGPDWGSKLPPPPFHSCRSGPGWLRRCQKGKGIASGGSAAPAPLPKGS